MHKNDTYIQSNEINMMREVFMHFSSLFFVFFFIVVVDSILLCQLKLTRVAIRQREPIDGNRKKNYYRLVSTENRSNNHQFGGNEFSKYKLNASIRYNSKTNTHRAYFLIS